MADDFQSVLVDLLKDFPRAVASRSPQDAESKLLAAYEKQVAKLQANVGTEMEVAKEGRDEGRACCDMHHQ